MSITNVTLWFLAIKSDGTDVTLDARTTFRTLKFVSGTGFYVDGSLALSNTNTETNSYNIWLLRGYDRYSNMQIASCKIWKDGNVVRDFIPCYRKSDGVIGLYDRVNRQFYTNAGTGTFLKGNNVQSSLLHTQKFIYDDSITLDANTFAYDGYIFKNWNTMPTGTGSSYEDEANISNVILSTNSTNIDLFAQWTSNYFEGNNGSGKR